MKKREIVDRLKDTLYITSTDDSLGIANRAGIEDSSEGGVTPEEMSKAIEESAEKIMTEVNKKEDLSNKVNINDPDTQLTNDMYPTAQSVVESLSHTLSDEDELIINCEL